MDRGAWRDIVHGVSATNQAGTHPTIQVHLGHRDDHTGPWFCSLLYSGTRPRGISPLVAQTYPSLSSTGSMLWVDAPWCAEPFPCGWAFRLLPFLPAGSELDTQRQPSSEHVRLGKQHSQEAEPGGGRAHQRLCQGREGWRQSGAHSK